jgi:hypothetical protein
LRLLAGAEFWPVAKTLIAVVANRLRIITQYVNYRSAIADMHGTIEDLVADGDKVA